MSALYPARLVRMTNIKLLEATVDCPALWGGGPRRRIQALPVMGLKGDTPDNTPVWIVRLNENHYRWLPREQDAGSPAWLERGRRAIYGPKGEVLVVLDENDSEVRLASNEASKRVVHEDVQGVLQKLLAFVEKIPVGTGPTAAIALATEYAAAKNAVDTESGYTADQVKAPETT